MPAKVPSVGSAAPEVAVAVTKVSLRPLACAAFRPRRSGPGFSTVLLLGLSAALMIVGFQNCSVDMLSSTPGASTSGACGSPPESALSDIAPVITGVLSTNCATCHGMTTGSVRSGYYTPDASADANDRSVQIFAYTQLCVRGGQYVGHKIDGTNSHTGGTFARGGGAAPLYNYLDTHFPAN